MKILQIATSLTSGGAEAVVRDLCLALVAQGHSVTLCLVRDAHSLRLDPAYEQMQKEKLIEQGVEITVLGAECRRRPWLGALRLRGVVSLVRPDVVHSHTIWGAAFAALGRIRQPIIFTQHTNRLKGVWAHRLWLRRWIKQYVAICQDAHVDIATQLRLPDDRLVKIHNGIELSRFFLRNGSASRVPRDFVAVGRLIASKNYEMMIKAFSAFLMAVPEEKRRNVNLHIVGEGELEANLRRLVDLAGLSQHVRFHGVRSDIPDLLSRMDVYLMASHYEGLSISLIEAVAVGMPIVATDVGGNREVLDDGKAGCLVPVDQAAFAGALSEVYASSELRERLVEGCSLHRQHFSIDRCAQQHAGLYARHIAGG